MSPDFNYSEVPATFLHCLNKQCKHSAKCMRYLVTAYVPANYPVISTVNPNYFSSHKESCPYFMADKKKRFALGITHLLDNVPHKEALGIKRELMAELNRTTYYRCYRKERLLKPKEQEYIRQLFLKRGIKEEPVYDEYVEQYEW